VALVGGDAGVEGGRDEGGELRRGDEEGLRPRALRLALGFGIAVVVVVVVTAAVLCRTKRG